MQRKLYPAKKATFHVDQKINQHLQWLSTIAKLVNNVLDPQLQPHIRVANINQERLVLEVASAVWATALRYRIPEILANIQRHPELIHIQKIDYYVKPECIPKAAIKKSVPLLSQPAAESLHSMANGIADEKLRGILQKIASYSKPKLTKTPQPEPRQ